MRGCCLSPFQLLLEAIFSTSAFARSCDIEREKRTTRYYINVILSWHVQAMEETLNNQPFFQAVVWACCNMLLKSLPCFREGFIQELLKSGDLAPENICLAHQELLGQECIGIGIQGSKVCFVGVEPHLRFAEQREWEQLKTDVIHCSASGPGLMVLHTSRKF